MSRGRFLIGDPLPFTAPQYDLLSTATELDVGNSKWKMGVTWEPLCPDTDATYDPCTAVVDGDPVVSAPDPDLKAETTQWDVRGAVPFTAYAEIDCSPVGVYDQLSNRTQQALTRAETRSVEQAFWSGVAGSNTAETVFPHLAADSTVIDGQDLLQEPATVVTSTPQPIEVAIGMMEDAFRDCYPGTATLHVPLRFGSLLSNDSLVTARGGTLTTLAGSKVVLGGGYLGTAPDGTDTAGAEWIYATGEVFYMRGGIERFDLEESINRSDNTVKAITERTYVVGWDCCLFAIPVDTEEVTA